MNTRYGLTEHRAYLQPMPDGNYAVLVIHEGPGGDSFMADAMASDHEFDRLVHGVGGCDPEASGPIPPAAQRRL